MIDTVDPHRGASSTQLIVLVVLLSVCQLVGVLGAVFTVDAIDQWYSTLTKPSWNPPNWIFGPVWTALYAMMAVAAWLVWRSDRWASTRPALTWFAVQLVLNAAWSILFFGMRSPGLAFLEIVALWIAIVMTLRCIRKHSQFASVMMLPYLGWTTFAAVLNFTIWRLNS